MRVNAQRVARGAVVSLQPLHRDMATLKELRSRIKSVHGIKKITASMKMVAAARLGKQERTTVATRPFAATLQKAFTAPKDMDLAGKKQVIAIITSDKGLCGSLNSTLVRPLQLELRQNAANISVACVGVKGRNGLATSFRDNIWFHVSEFGKNPVTFAEVSIVADQLVNSPDKTNTDVLRVQYNHYLNMVQSRPTDTKLLSKKAFTEQKDVLQKYDFDGGLKDEDVLADLYDFLVAGVLYGGVMENQAAELGMRMSSMENATKNCGEVLAGLNLKYNRQRQAAITTELTEIISGAESLNEQD
jgi:ATP synthase F1 gamma subunit